MNCAVNLSNCFRRHAAEWHACTFMLFFPDLACRRWCRWCPCSLGTRAGCSQCPPVPSAILLVHPFYGSASPGALVHRVKWAAKEASWWIFSSSGSGGRAQELLVPGMLSRIGKVQPCSSKHLGFSVSRNTRLLKAARGVVWLCQLYRGEQWWSLHWCHLGLENCMRQKGVKGVTQHWFSWLSGAHREQLFDCWSVLLFKCH